MIESRYWKKDLLLYAKRFKPVAKPPRWSNKSQVNFEKEIIVAFFMIRKLIETYKVSSKTTKYRSEIFCSPNILKVNNLNFMHIDEIYDLDIEKTTHKSINFLCNQFIHGGAIFAIRGNDRNWESIYTCSDFERQKYIYRIPILEIIKILEIVGHDYPNSVRLIYSDINDDYIITTD